MMEDGLSKLEKVTPKFDNLGPRLSGATPKTSLTDSLFGLLPSDDKIPASGNKQEEWIPVHFKTSFKDHNLCQSQGVMVFLPSGVQLSSNVIAVVQSKGTILKISIKVPGAIMDPKQFLCFQRKGIYHPLMEICAGACISAFYETMSTVHTSLCDSMWREFQLNLDFPFQDWRRVFSFISYYPTIYERSQKIILSPTSIGDPTSFGDLSQTAHIK